METLVGQGCLARVPGRPSIRVMQRRLTYSTNRRGSSLQALTLLEGTRFIAWRISRLFKWNADGARGILGNAGLRPSTRTHLKRALCHTCSFWWGARQLLIWMIKLTQYGAPINSLSPFQIFISLFLFHPLSLTFFTTFSKTPSSLSLKTSYLYLWLTLSYV